MLSGLGHHALVSGDDKKGGLDTTHASQHVLDKILMTGHVYHTYLLARRQCQPGKAQVNGHLTFFFFFETVRINARERFNQR